MSGFKAMAHDPSDAVWKALADGTRRRMLEVIRETPGCTVVRLRAALELSRACLDHLRALERAGLVPRDAKVGRERQLRVDEELLRACGRWVARQAGSPTELAEDRQVLSDMDGEPSDAVWRALAHATRRRMLDRVRDTPGCSVGRLCAAFDQSRTGVLAHLEVLERAGLVPRMAKVGAERLLSVDAALLHRTCGAWLERQVTPSTGAPREPTGAPRLRRVVVGEGGIRRVGKRYIGEDGRAVRDEGTLARIRALALPPSWKEVWICTSADGVVQASGRDLRGRTQLRYHPRWREWSDETKQARTLALAQALPRLRSRLEQDLALRGLPRAKVLAAVTRLLDLTSARIGNALYERENRSFGLTTLHDRHTTFSRSGLRLEFRGKAGVEQEIAVADRKLAAIVRRCRDLPGAQLFQYEDEDGSRRTVTSNDVNDYLREATGLDVTAKDFRTWSATVTAARALAEAGPVRSQTEAQRNVARALRATAKHLGNTPRICAESYVHPGLVEAYLDGRLLPVLVRHKPPPAGLGVEEAALLELLGQCGARGVGAR
ncbi:MAG: helix-turn-helix domain-containing protein [Myxococcales bacterium]